jgi:hypothetical protein
MLLLLGGGIGGGVCGLVVVAWACLGSGSQATQTDPRWGDRATIHHSTGQQDQTKTTASFGCLFGFH